MTDNAKRIFLLLAWVTSLSALLGTIYASEILNYPICHLCWYQRICIYPLAIILGIANFRDDMQIAIYTIPLSVIGAGFALYQYLEQMIPGFAPIDLCKVGPACSEIHLNFFGFVTFPFLSLVACIFITVCLVLSYRSRLL